MIEHFDFDFKPGITLVKGASGCGKSTLLRLLAGFLSPQAGYIHTPTGSLPTDTNYQRRELGFVFQQLNLLPLATLRRNLALAASLAGLSRRSKSPIQLRALAASARPGTLRRAHAAFAFGRPAAGRRNRPRRREGSRSCCPLDEPTSGLDDLNTRVITRALERFVTGDRICVVSSHDSRLEHLAHEILDFNRFLPLERHLETLV